MVWKVTYQTRTFLWALYNLFQWNFVALMLLLSLVLFSGILFAVFFFRLLFLWWKHEFHLKMCVCVCVDVEWWLKWNDVWKQNRFIWFGVYEEEKRERKNHSTNEQVKKSNQIKINRIEKTWLSSPLFSILFLFLFVLAQESEQMLYELNDNNIICAVYYVIFEKWMRTERIKAPK